MRAVEGHRRLIKGPAGGLCAVLGLCLATPCAAAENRALLQSVMGQTLIAQDWDNTAYTLGQSIDWRVALDQQSALSPRFGQAQTTETTYVGSGYSETLSLSQNVVWGPPESSPFRQAQPWDENHRVDLAYQRQWTAAYGRTPSGLEVSLTPHTGVTYSSDGSSAEAGATLRIGQNLRHLAQNGDEVFGNRPRWYLFAAGSKRAVGYNLARGRDGELSRAGLTHDRGSSIGDATIGVAYRRGPVESSIGIVYRENETKGLRSFDGIKTDVGEGILAFQLSIRPR